MRNSENSGDITIALARFQLNHRITATRRTVSVDGGNTEWATTDDALFVGEKSQAQATLRCSCDDRNVYFLVEVLDEAISRDDYVNILLSPANEGDRLTSAARRIKVSHSGLKSTDVYAGGWRETDMGVTVQAAYDGTLSDNSDTDHGYLVEVAVPAFAARPRIRGDSREPRAVRQPGRRGRHLPHVVAQHRNLDTHRRAVKTAVRKVARNDESSAPLSFPNASELFFTIFFRYV